MVGTVLHFDHGQGSVLRFGKVIVQIAFFPFGMSPTLGLCGRLRHKNIGIPFLLILTILRIIINIVITAQMNIFMTEIIFLQVLIIHQAFLRFSVSSNLVYHIVMADCHFLSL
jgi:hypothetical protein